MLQFLAARYAHRQEKSPITATQPHSFLLFSRVLFYANARVTNLFSARGLIRTLDIDYSTFDFLPHSLLWTILLMLLLSDIIWAILLILPVGIISSAFVECI